MASELRQIASTFKFQALAWVGIVGAAITLFDKVNSLLELADWARELVVHWHEWNEQLWGWVFSFLKVEVPKELVPAVSFTVFTAMLVVGTNLGDRVAMKSVQPPHNTGLAVKLRRFGLGVLLYLPALWSVAMIAWLIEVLAPEDEDITVQVTTALLLVMGWVIVFPLGYLLYVCKHERLFVFVTSLLFLIMAGCLLLVPLWQAQAQLVSALSLAVLLQMCWMAVILFSPLQQLTKRLSFVVLGVLILVAANEISKRHWRLKPAKEARNCLVVYADRHTASTGVGALYLR